MVIVFCFVASGTVTNLFPTIVETLGYSKVISLLLTVPPYALAVLTTFLNAWHADRTGERYFHITTPLYFSVIAYIIAATTTAVGPRYFAMMLMPASVYTGYVVALAWISNTLPRPPAKVRLSPFINQHLPRPSITSEQPTNQYASLARRRPRSDQRSQQCQLHLR